MKPEDHIIKQLKKQNIEFKILQGEYNPDLKSLVSETVIKWKKKFIANRNSPYWSFFLNW